MESRFERFKDFIYNYSDIFITLIIIVAALVLITWRTGIVLDYTAGDEAAANAAAQAAEEAENGEEGNGAALSAEPENPDGTEEDTAGIESQMSPDGSVYTITIPTGATSYNIANILLQSGLISDTQSFLDAVSASGADSRLKAGTFTIPAGSTNEDIITILTQ